MTTNIKDARRLLKAARRSDRVALALPYLFDPWLVAIERLLRRGVVGEVRMVRCRIAHGIDHPSTSWFAQKKKAQGGALFDLGVYAVALLVDLFGPVRTVSGLFGKPTAGVTVEQNALLSLGFASGLIGTVETSWQEPAAQAYLSIYGRKATLDCSGGRIRLLSGPRKAWTPVRSKEIPFAKKLQMPTNVCRHWADCIQKGTRPLIPIERGLHLMEVLCAGYTSVAEGGIVRVRSTP
jgi:glucose-fructose oxidoreductase